MQRWLGAKKISTVMMILIGLGVTPALVVTAISVYRESGEIAYVDDELLAAVDFHHLEEITSHASSRMIMGVLPESRRDAAKYAANEKDLDTAVEKVRAAMVKANKPALEPFWQAVVGAYGEVKTLSPGSTSTEQWFGAHEKLFAVTLKLRDRVGVETGVILDPGSETYPMVDATFVQVPDFEVEMGRAVGYGVLLTQGHAEPRIVDGVVLAMGNLAVVSDGISGDLADAIHYSSVGADGYEEVQRDLQKTLDAHGKLATVLAALRIKPDPAKLDKLLYEAVAALAHVHSHWWDAPSLGSTVGTLHTETALREMVAGFRSHLPGLFEDLGNDLPLADRLVLEEVFNSSLRPWLRLLDQRALTVIHGDAHTWNFLFPRSGQGSTYLIDWQLWHLDIGARDLAFMIALHWDRTARQQLELPLLHFYHDELIGAGINSYSFDDLLLDYRRCLVRNLTVPILFWSRGQRRESWRHRLDCALAAYRDLNCAELL